MAGIFYISVIISGYLYAEMISQLIPYSTLHFALLARKRDIEHLKNRGSSSSSC